MAPHPAVTGKDIDITSHRRPGATSPLRPAAPSIVFVGAGRNAHNLMGIFEAAGVDVRYVVDDAAPGTVLGKAVETIDGIAGEALDAFLTITDPEIARAVRARPAVAQCRWPSFAFPNAVVSEYAAIGEGSYIGPFSLVTDAQIGRHVHLFTHNSIGARARIGDFSAILPQAMISSDVIIGTGCLIGSGALVSAGVTIGDNCRIGANVVVRRDMPPGSIALPARTLVHSRTRFKSAGNPPHA